MLHPKFMRPLCESLEARWLLAWSPYAKLVNQDDAASDFASITGKGVTVAVIDTGIDYNRPELGGGFGPGTKSSAGYDFFANDADPMDESGHGTSVASVIAAKPYTTGGITYQGVAPMRSSSPCASAPRRTSPTTTSKKPSSGSSPTTRPTASRSSTCRSARASIPIRRPARSSAMSSRRCTTDGIFVVAASGNSNDQVSGPISQDGIAYPAADPNVFAVGAVDSSDIITTWSQRGDELDLLAPGVNIVMPDNCGGGYVTEDGTSFASPYVAGTAALIKQADPTAKAGDIGSILMTSGTNNRDGVGRNRKHHDAPVQPARHRCRA